jgi:NitT/TauT family transport system substrate-binding protein
MERVASCKHHVLPRRNEGFAGNSVFRTANGLPNKGNHPARPADAGQFARSVPAFNVGGCSSITPYLAEGGTHCLAEAGKALHPDLANHRQSRRWNGMSLHQRRHGLARSWQALVAAALLVLATTPLRADPLTVRVGMTRSISDAMLFIADKKGFFRAEGIEVALTPFNSAANMVAPLGVGDLDVGAGSASAGLYNAVTRGIQIRIVADKSSSRPGYPGNKLIVRKDLVESGRFTGLASLKGMTVAMNGAGVSNTSTLNTALGSVGLRYSDVTTVDMAFPDHVISLRNRSVDASVSTEPTATAAIRAGVAVLVKGDDEIDPNHQIAVLLYSEPFARNTDAANRFMRAYLRGVRFYNDALRDGRMAGPTAEEVIDIVTEYTALKDKAVLRDITPTGCDPTGRVNVASLQRDLDFYTARGLVSGKVDLHAIIDESFVEAANRAAP